MSLLWNRAPLGYLTGVFWAVLLIVSDPAAGTFGGFFAKLGSAEAGSEVPAPLLSADHAVDWWFVFKFNTKSFPGCGGSGGDPRVCRFGGKVQPYKGFSQQFAYASSKDQSLKKGTGCAGETLTDPVGATFQQIYNQSFSYVVWNDQFYGDPRLDCANTKGNCDKPWGHSKGLLAWSETGEGLVLQVTTPSWPGAASESFPRKRDGNTLGCVKDNNVKVSQHFFAAKLSKDDVVKVLNALENASVVTDPKKRQVVTNVGPADIRSLVDKLGSRSSSNTHLDVVLSTGIRVISKPSRLHVPPWQMVSAVLGGTSLRTATWWAFPQIYTTTGSTKIDCWDSSLGRPGRVEIATTGQWDGKEFGLRGGPSTNSNHAKIGVSISGTRPYVIFGDLNQQGALSGDCTSSQNGRGGLFFVVESKTLFDSVTALIDGNTAPTKLRKP